MLSRVAARQRDVRFFRETRYFHDWSVKPDQNQWRTIDIIPAHFSNNWRRTGEREREKEEKQFAMRRKTFVLNNLQRDLYFVRTHSVTNAADTNTVDFIAELSDLPFFFRQKTYSSSRRLNFSYLCLFVSLSEVANWTPPSAPLPRVRSARSLHVRMLLAGTGSISI